MKEKTPFFIILKDLANKFRGRFACLGLKYTSREIDPGYHVVFRASKFYKSLAWWLVMQVARCRTLLKVIKAGLQNGHFVWHIYLAWRWSRQTFKIVSFLVPRFLYVMPLAWTVPVKWWFYQGCLSLNESDFEQQEYRQNEGVIIAVVIAI